MQNQPTKRQSARVQLQNQSLFYMATTINLRFQPTSVLFDTAHPILHFGIHGSQALFMLQSFHSFPQDKQQTIRVVESVVFRHWEATLPFISYMLYWYCLWYCIISKLTLHSTKYTLAKGILFQHDIASVPNFSPICDIFLSRKSNSLSCQEPSVTLGGGKLSWFSHRRTCLFRTLVVNLTIPVKGTFFLDFRAELKRHRFFFKSAAKVPLAIFFQRVRQWCFQLLQSLSQFHLLSSIAEEVGSNFREVSLDEESCSEVDTSKHSHFSIRIGHVFGIVLGFKCWSFNNPKENNRQVMHQGSTYQDGAQTNKTIRMPTTFRCVLLPSSPCVAESRPQREGLCRWRCQKEHEYHDIWSNCKLV